MKQLSELSREYLATYRAIAAGREAVLNDVIELQKSILDAAVDHGRPRLDLSPKRLKATWLFEPCEGVREEVHLRLRTFRPNLLSRLSERLFFAVNKIDLQNSRGRSPEQTREYVAQLLGPQIPGLEISADRVLLVSAEQGLLSRLIATGRADEGAVRDFAKRVFGIIGQRDATLEKCQPHAGMLLAESRLPELEEEVISYIYTNRGQLFLQSTLDDVDRHMTSLANFFRTTSRGLKLENEDLSRTIRALELDLAETDRGFDEIDELTSRTIQEVETWVKQRFEGFNNTVAWELQRALASERSEPADAMHEILRSARKQLLGKEVRDKQKAQQRIQKVNTLIAQHLKSEFNKFWVQLAQELFQRQGQLFAQLSSKVTPLARKIEETVGRRLDVSLQPVPINIPAPAVEEMKDSIGERIDEFVERRERVEAKERTERVRTKEGGLCSEDEYEYVTLTRNQQVVSYRLSPESVQEFWLKWLRDRTRVSIATAHTVIKEEVGSAVEQARAELTRYRDGYVRTLEQSLTESQKGEQERRARLASVERSLKQLAELQESMTKTREFLEGAAR